MAQENCLRSSVQKPTSMGPCPVNEPSLCNSKLTTQQWNLNNFGLPLTIDAILVVTISATGSARLSRLVLQSLQNQNSFLLCSSPRSPELYLM